MTECEWLECIVPLNAYQFLRSAAVTHKSRWQGWITTQRYPVSERKLRLFVCACVRRIAHLLPLDEHRQLLARAETFAEGEIDGFDLEKAEQECDFAVHARLKAGSRWLGHERDAIAAVHMVHRTEAAGRLGSLASATLAWAGARVWERYVQSLGGVLRVRPAEFAPLEAVVRTCDRPYLLAECAAETARHAELLRDIVGNPFRASEPEPYWLFWNNGVVAEIAQAIYDGQRFEEFPILADALEDAGCQDTNYLSHCRSSTLHARGCWVIDRLLGKE
jgi:hypothetical protein